MFVSLLTLLGEDGVPSVSLRLSLALRFASDCFSEFNDVEWVDGALSLLWALDSDLDRDRVRHGDRDLDLIRVGLCIDTFAGVVGRD